MKQTIAIIGGTGKAGKYLVAQLITQGFSIRLLLRNPAAYPQVHPLLTIGPGDVREPAAVVTLLAGCSAVISTLGQPQGGQPVFSQATTNILQAMAQQQVQRYIVVTGLSIDVAGDEKTGYAAQATAWMKQSFPAVIADKQEEYRLLTASVVQWTLVRVPLIRQTEEFTGVLVNRKDCLGEYINATDLAVFLTAQLTDLQYIQAAPFVASRSIVKE